MKPYYKVPKEDLILLMIAWYRMDCIDSGLSKDDYIQAWLQDKMILSDPFVDFKGMAEWEIEDTYGDE